MEGEVEMEGGGWLNVWVFLMHESNPIQTTYGVQSWINDNDYNNIVWKMEGDGGWRVVKCLVMHESNLNNAQTHSSDGLESQMSLYLDRRVIKNSNYIQCTMIGK